MLELEWDGRSGAANVERHGLKLLDWDNATYIQDTRFPYSEPRYWAFVLWKHRLHLVAFCRRGGWVRIISCRKANRKEVKRYGR